MKKIAVTGALGTGKSAVCQLLKKKGAIVLNADEIIHELYSSPNSDLGKKIISLLGQDVVVAGSFSKKLIAEKVFNNSDKLLQLEQLLHPEVQRAIDAKFNESIKTKDSPLFVVEVPLLFEVGWEPFFDTTLTVVADVNICQKRFEDRGGKLSDFKLRTERQLPMDEKAKRADIVVTNNGSLQDLEKTMEMVYQKLL